MARHEQDREDLIADATALVQRAEINVPTDDDAILVVVGFRRNGAMSCYFGTDPAYHFNTNNQLRRAFVAGKLLKAEGGNLISMRRERDAEQVYLLSHEMPQDEVSQLLAAMSASLQTVAMSLRKGTATVVRQVPSTDETVGQRLQERITATMLSVSLSPEIAARPNVN